MLMEGACMRRRLAPPRAKCLVQVAYSTVSKFNI
ncbi:hypothetical protein MTR67_034766 [Solanum verrucosum]|uniref:Uncharacterized protein n=1 Tax=Solanum verrucosum TaxID=315347 RepID=A0AAF0U942_SOLVR|nr:hypothetical protein MTR67_034766 [Solanum verrucosum]